MEQIGKINCESKGWPSVVRKVYHVLDLLPLHNVGELRVNAFRGIEAEVEIKMRMIDSSLWHYSNYKNQLK